MSSVELRTERLLLRQPREEDVEPMTAINSHPEVHEFLAATPDRELTAAGIGRSQEHWERHGYGHFMVEATAGELAGQLLGFCGVAHPAFVPELAERPELGYRLGRFAWGRGYATEAAVAARGDVFERCELPEVISLIDPRNERSQRVAEKGGLEPGGTVVNPLTGLDLVVWSRANVLLTA
jgi:RimJ/RimL family protein N-acetyltransferase